MEDQINTEGQNTLKIEKNQTNFPCHPSLLKKSKLNLLIISTFVLFFLFIGSLSIYFSNIKSIQKNLNQPAVQTPTPIIQRSIADIALAFIKDGSIYIADHRGAIDKVFEINKEEFLSSENLYKAYMKLSPDKNYLAYLGTSGGLDSAIKIVDIKQKKKVSEEIYGSAYITDFAWSPDSKKIVVAVNLQNEERRFMTSLYLIDPLNQTGGTPLFKVENIEISQVEWPDAQNIYYSRFAYSLENTAIVHYNFENKSRNLKIIWDEIPGFAIKFLVSSDKKDILSCVGTKNNLVPLCNLQTLSLPSLEKNSTLLSNIPIAKFNQFQWYKNYLVDIEKDGDSLGSSIFLINMSEEEQKIRLLHTGQNGLFHSIKLLEQNEKLILVVWSEHDGQQSIIAYDFDKLIEKRKKGLTSEPLWKLNNSSSFDL